MTRRFERAMIAAKRANSEEYAIVTRWLDRWEVALSLCQKESIDDDSEVYDIIAPTDALNELPQGIVSRFWHVSV